MTRRQGWDRADYRCGRCGAGFTATTEAGYVTAYQAHKDAHAILDRMTPEQREALDRLLRHIRDAAPAPVPAPPADAFDRWDTAPPGGSGR